MENSRRDMQNSNSSATQRAMIGLAVLAVVAIGMIVASYAIVEPGVQPDRRQAEDVGKVSDVLPTSQPSEPTNIPTESRPQSQILQDSEVVTQTELSLQGLSMAAGTEFIYDPYGLGLRGVYRGKNEQGEPLVEPLSEVAAASARAATPDGDVPTLDMLYQLAELELKDRVKRGDYRGFVALPAEHQRAPFDPNNIHALQCPAGFQSMGFGGGVIGQVCIPR